MHIEPNEIHIYSANLETSPFQENPSLLARDERERANRFQFPIHRQRFIAARSLLRTLISLYIHTPPASIVFSYTDKKKPWLENSPLHFNLSHSDRMAVFALTLHHPVGVDIEKIREDYREGVAERYFAESEKTALQNAPPAERSQVFYRLWARKEALVKAIGTGISQPLSSFSVSAEDDFERIMIDNESWLLMPLLIDKDYQAAVATHQQVKKITYWKFDQHTPVLDKIENL